MCERESGQNKKEEGPRTESHRMLEQGGRMENLTLFD